MIKVINRLKSICIRHPLSRITLISNFFFGPFSTLSNCPQKFVRYLKRLYLELSLLCRNIFAVPSALFRAALHPPSWTFSLHSFQFKEYVWKLWSNIRRFLFQNNNMLAKRKLNFKNSGKKNQALKDLTFQEKCFSCSILLICRISLFGFLYFVRYWAMCVL